MIASRDKILCPECAGEGTVWGTYNNTEIEAQCPYCQGARFTYLSRAIIDFPERDHSQFKLVCPRCFETHSILSSTQMCNACENEVISDAKKSQQGGPWTSHGHEIKGVTVAGKGRPAVARCGGPGLCKICSAEAESIRNKKQ